MHATKRGEGRLGTYISLVVFTLYGILAFTEMLYAQNTYTPLVGLPAVAGTNQGLGAYFNKLYMATVAVGAILAFLKIAFAGAKWSLSEIVSDKASAKNDIKGALLGLAILLIPFIVLNTIYSGLTNLNILDRAGTNATNVREKMNILNAPAGNGTAPTPTPAGATTPPPSPPSGVEFGAQTVVRNYTPAQLGCAPIASGAVGGEFGGESMYSCDMTAARASCTSLNGTFTVTSRDLATGIETASCTFVEATAPSTASCQTGGPC